MSEQATATGKDRAVRIGRVLDSFVSRREHGERVSEDELLRQYPDIADELRLHLDLLGELPPVSQRIDVLVAKGILTASGDERYLAQLGEYRITDLLGRGGMGIVLQAYEPKLDRLVALKILRPDLSDDQAVLRRFKREAKAAAALKQASIVTVYTVGEHKGTHFIAMEYVDGPTLSGLIRNTVRAAGFSPRGSDISESTEATWASARDSSSALETATIRVIIRQLLNALSAAHEAGLIHRDVKSSNILLDLHPGKARSASELPVRRRIKSSHKTISPPPPLGIEPQLLIPELSFRVKLADFGLARLAGSHTTLTKPDSILGTPEYMSPEQARGDEDIDHRTDLYSAGVVLYEMLTGRTPFKADTPTAVIHQIIHTDPHDPREINPEADPVLASLALRLMAKEREERYASAREVLAVLDAGTEVRQPIPRRYRRRLTGVMFLTVALGLAAGLGGWLSETGGDRGGAHFRAAPSDTTPPISEVRVEPGVRRHIQARFGDSAEWKNLEWDVLSAYENRFRQTGRNDALYVPPALVQLGPRQLVVVGCFRPLENDACVVVAFDLDGNEVWRIPLNTEFARDKTWPDCPGTPRAWWQCRQIVAHDLGGRLGDELIVVARDPIEYPTRISIVDPRTGWIDHTFWHVGDIVGLLVLDDLLDEPATGRRRPAIVAWGVNNKLDGFCEELPGDPEPVTSAEKDIVTVAMILDPQNMDGIGPPHAQRFGIPPAMPWAYAFVDFHARVRNSIRTNDGEIPRAQIRQVAWPLPGIDAATADDARTLRVKLLYADPRHANEQDAFWLLADRDLGFLRVSLGDWSIQWADQVDWESKWRPIIQHGDYIPSRP